MNTLAQVAAFAVELIAGWKPNVNIQNDVEDAILVLNGAQNAGITQTPLGGVLLKQLTKDAASFTNLADGQVAQAFTVGATFGATADKVLIFAVRQYNGLTPPADSPAAKLKDMLGY